MIRTFQGIKPTVPKSCFIEETAVVIGDVVMGDECSVWFNAVVRGDVNHIRIGRRSNLQDGTIVHVMRDTHATQLGDEVTVGHGAILHGCVIADRCLIGMGAVLLNGVTIASDSIVAAGTLIPEETRIPPRSLVMGRPGKVRRELSDQEIASILDYAGRYVGYRLHYMPQVS